MIQYVFDDEDELMISAYDQHWDAETLKQLRDEHDIIFMTNGDGVKPVKVINPGMPFPLLAIGAEDDGTICFKKRYGQYMNCFSPYWVDSLTADLQEAVKFSGYKKQNLTV